jgi:hypothetical protein
MTVAELLARASSYELEEWKVADKLEAEDELKRRKAAQTRGA